MGRNTLIILTSSILYALSQWFIVALLTKIDGVEKVGYYVIALAIISPLMILAQFGLRQVLVTSKNEDNIFYDYLKLRIIFSTLALLFALLISFVSYEEYVTHLVGLIGLAKLIENISDIYNADNQKNEKFTRVAVSKILRSLGVFLSFSLGYYYFSDLYFALIVQMLCWLFILIFYDLKVDRERGETFKKSDLARLIKISSPLALTTFVISLNANVQRYMTDYFTNPEVLGIFSSLFFFVTAMGLVVQSIGQVITPRLANYSKNQNKKLYLSLVLKAMLFVLSFEVVFIVFAYVFGKGLLTLIYNSTVADNLSLFVLILLCSIPLHLSSIIGYSLTALGEYKVQPKIFLFSMLVNVVVSYFCGAKFGVEGVLLGIFASSVISGIVMIIIILKTIKKRVDNEEKNIACNW